MCSILINATTALGIMARSIHDEVVTASIIIIVGAAGSMIPLECWWSNPTSEDGGCPDSTRTAVSSVRMPAKDSCVVTTLRTKSWLIASLLVSLLVVVVVVVVVVAALRRVPVSEASALDVVEAANNESVLLCSSS